MDERVRKVIESFDALKRLLKDKAVCYDDTLLIYDPPVEIKIMRKERLIVFSVRGKDFAVISEELSVVEEDYEEYVEEWLTALSSLGFKRYLPKRLRGKNY